MIILAATPIGNLGDASPRLVAALEAAGTVAAEDTRVAAQLMRALGVVNRPRLVPLHEHNEVERSARLVEEAREADLLVLTDAGMPTVSDPGFVLVRAAVATGVEVTVIPGPSAVLAALAVSGLPTDRFAFEGFVPRKGRRAALAAVAADPRTLVFFESPHRLADSLADAAAAFGADRPAAVCRELTKLHEEVARGPLGELAERFAEGARGEIVLVVAGAPATPPSLDDALAEVLALTAEGVGLRDAASRVAAETGASRRALYEAALRAR